MIIPTVSTKKIIVSLRLNICSVSIKLAGNGTAWRCGELGASSASIDSRWQRLNRKLGSPHRHASARLAAKFGLI
jgi:DNA-binding CsgD family transcriptional regulator